LIEATPAGYNLKGTFTPDYQKGASWSHPVVVNRKLYLREQDKLVCYQSASSLTGVQLIKIRSPGLFAVRRPGFFCS